MKATNNDAIPTLDQLIGRAARCAALSVIVDWDVVATMYVRTAGPREDENRPFGRRNQWEGVMTGAAATNGGSSIARCSPIIGCPHILGFPAEARFPDKT
ncbi:MAG: hypothetical protein KDA63_08670 [Planctomycetales bacterium]|nr:hypothetical protein [Planctomycetales bacterium]